jgi:hypothetical protein
MPKGAPIGLKFSALLPIFILKISYLIFYLALVKGISDIGVFIFGIFLTVHCLRICSKTVS